MNGRTGNKLRVCCGGGYLGREVIAAFSSARNLKTHGFDSISPLQTA
jgi:hypothetical protein